jgi:paraquat-inducible protein B
MSDQQPPEYKQAHIRRYNFSFVWLIPIITAILALWLGWRTLEQRGPMITITLDSGDGLVVDQTQVKYREVTLGIVKSVRLSKDMKHVVVHVRMRAEAEKGLTDKTMFWIVRPRINAGKISGLETLLSGAYIAMDPGEPSEHERLKFIGLENPPGLRSDEPGTPYTLLADSLNGISQGSPVFYRDIDVGEVLGYDQPGIHNKITVHVLIRKPYDHYVHASSRFWDTSGVQISLGAGGLHVQMESLQALLSGGIAFTTPLESLNAPPALANSTFDLFNNHDSAIAAIPRDHIKILSYFSGLMRGLTVGSAVEIEGMRVGIVTDMRLEYDTANKNFRVPVHMVIEPDLIFLSQGRNLSDGDIQQVLHGFLQRGIQAEVQTSSYLTGEMVVELEMTPNAKPGMMQMQDGEIIIPGQTDGINDIITSLGSLAAKLDHIPFDQISHNVNDMFSNINHLVVNPEVKTSIHNLSVTLANIRTLVHKTDAGLSPVLKQLPELEANLEQAIKNANDVLGEKGYGNGGGFQRDVMRLMDQATNTLRTIKSLADFLERHPESLIRGHVRDGAN